MPLIQPPSEVPTPVVEIHLPVFGGKHRRVGKDQLPTLIQHPVFAPAIHVLTTRMRQHVAAKMSRDAGLGSKIDEVVMDGLADVLGVPKHKILKATHVCNDAAHLMYSVGLVALSYKDDLETFLKPWGVSVILHQVVATIDYASILALNTHHADQIPKLSSKALAAATAVLIPTVGRRWSPMTLTIQRAAEQLLSFGSLGLETHEMDDLRTCILLARQPFGREWTRKDYETLKAATCPRKVDYVAVNALLPFWDVATLKNRLQKKVIQEKSANESECTAAFVLCAQYGLPLCHPALNVVAPHPSVGFCVKSLSQAVEAQYGCANIADAQNAHPIPSPQSPTPPNASAAAGPPIVDAPAVDVSAARAPASRKRMREGDTRSLDALLSSDDECRTQAKKKTTKRQRRPKPTTATPNFDNTNLTMAAFTSPWHMGAPTFVRASPTSARALENLPQTNQGSPSDLKIEKSSTHGASVQPTTAQHSVLTSQRMTSTNDATPHTSSAQQASLPAHTSPAFAPGAPVSAFGAPSFGVTSFSYPRPTTFNPTTFNPPPTQMPTPKQAQPTSMPTPVPSSTAGGDFSFKPGGWGDLVPYGGSNRGWQYPNPTGGELTLPTNQNFRNQVAPQSDVYGVMHAMMSMQLQMMQDMRSEITWMRRRLESH